MFASNGGFPAHGGVPVDPLDSADYDPIIHLNTLFSHPYTLSAVPSTSHALRNHLDSLDNEITQLVITQSTTNADSLARISSAKVELAGLLENVDTVRERAIRTEDAIAAMTADIKKLDSTKRNLTLSMTVLKRLQMLTTAYEQMKTQSKNRQYRECASLMSAVLELMAHFRSFRSIDQIATLSRNVADLKAELLEQVCEDFEMAFVKGEVSTRKGMLSEACTVMDALGDGARARLVTWYCNTQLREYRQVFRGNDEAGSLDNISRRYAWLKRILKVYDDEHTGIFPLSWKVDEMLVKSFCDGTRDDFKGILQRALRKEGGKSLDVNLLLKCLQETLDFEHYLERRFSADRMSIDTVSSRDERPLIFGKAISEAFEPYLSLWVDDLDRQLSAMIPKYRIQPLRSGDEDFTPSSSVLPSSIELFHFYRLSLAQCAKLSTGSKLLDLSKIFAKHLDQYAEAVLLNYFSPMEKAGALVGEDIVVVLNTADYAHATTQQLEDKVKSKVDPEFSFKVDFEKQQDALLGVVTSAIRLLVRKVEVVAEPAWREMRNTPWSRLEAVGDQSGYVNVLLSSVKETVGEILALTGKETYQRAFCDKVVEAMATGFLGSLVACRPIGGVGAEQMLLDAYVMRKVFEDLLTLKAEPGTPPPVSYIKHVQRSMSKIDTLLKTLQVQSSPPECLVQAYLIHVCDKSDTNFRKILDLKGIRRQDQASFVELFRAHMVTHDNLVEANPFLSTLLVPSGSIGAPGGAGGMGGVGGSGMIGSSSVGGLASGVGGLSGPSGLVPARFDPASLGSAIMNAARDGVDRLQTPVSTSSDGGNGGQNQIESGERIFERHLGRLFKRDGSGIGMGGRFTRDGG
ncbi:Vps53-like protein [Tuber indicum]|nr:Vps53-like protein [Tuber indicum]